MFGFAIILALEAVGPASFHFTMDANTDYAVFLGEKRIEPGTKYPVGLIHGTKCLELTIRAINGGHVEEIPMIIEVEAGFHVQWDIKIRRNPPLIVEV